MVKFDCVNGASDQFVAKCDCLNSASHWSMANLSSNQPSNVYVSKQQKKGLCKWPRYKGVFTQHSTYCRISPSRAWTTQAGSWAFAGIRRPAGPFWPIWSPRRPAWRCGCSSLCRMRTTVPACTCTARSVSARSCGSSRPFCRYLIQSKVGVRGAVRHIKEQNNLSRRCARTNWTELRRCGRTLRERLSRTRLPQKFVWRQRTFQESWCIPEFTTVPTHWCAGS